MVLEHCLWEFIRKQVILLGKIISGWSEMGHQNGVTVNIAVMAYIMAERFPQKNILTMDTNTAYTELEYLMKSQHNKKLNMDNLNNSLEAGSLNKKYFCECCVEVKDNLYNINAARELSGNRFEQKNLLTIIETAKELFDLVIIDNSPDISGTALKVNESADVVINFMKQNNSRFDYLSQKAIIYQSEKVINVINEYSLKKGLDIKNIKKCYGLKNIFPINYFENIIYSMNLKEPERLCMGKDEESLNYLRQMNLLIDDICRRIDFEIKKKDEPKRKFNIFKLAAVK